MVTSKNLIYTVVSFLLIVVMSVGSAFIFVQIDGQNLAQVVGIEKPRELRSLYGSDISTDISTLPVIPSKHSDNNTTTEAPAHLKSDTKQIQLPLNLPQSVIKKHTFTSSSKFEKPLASVLKNIKLPVLMYHHIDSGAGIPAGDGVGHGLRVSPQVFEKQLQYIQSKGYATINSDDLYAFMEFGVALPINPILLTFDDGYKDNLQQALPILQKYNMIGDFGIVTGVVGTGEYMNWDDHKILLKAGNSISSHTVNHCYLAINVNPKTGTLGPFQSSPTDDTAGQICPRFTFGGQLNTGQIRGELKQSRDDIEKNLGTKTHFLIYPFGKYNPQVIQIAKDLGYSMATSVEPQYDGVIDLLNNPFAIHRIRMQGQQAGEITRFLD